MSKLDMKKAGKIKKELPYLKHLHFSFNDALVKKHALIFWVQCTKRLWKTGKLKFIKKFEYSLTDIKGNNLFKVLRRVIKSLRILKPTKLNVNM